MVCIAGIVPPDDQHKKEQGFSPEESIGIGYAMGTQKFKKGFPESEGQGNAHA